MATTALGKTLELLRNATYTTGCNLAKDVELCEAAGMADRKVVVTPELRTRLEVGNRSLLRVLQLNWESLLAQSDRNEPFLHPAWFRAYASAFQPEAQITVIHVSQGKTLVGAFPLVARTRCFGMIPARTLRSLSGKHSCRFDLIVSSKQRPAAIAALWEALRSDDSWDALEALDVPDGAAFEDLAAHAAADGYLVAKWPTLLSPYLTIPCNGDDPYANCPRHYKKVRARLENALRRLAGVGDVRFEVATTDHTEALRRFISMELSGWKGARGSAIGCAQSTHTFYHSVAEAFATTGALRIYTLWVNQTAVAMELGLVANGVYFSPKATYSEEYASFSPGHLLTRHIISDLARNGIGRYDFLGPRARHKTIWAGEVLPHATYRVFRPTLLGRMRYIAVGNIAPMLRSVKRRLEGDPQQTGI